MKRSAGIGFSNLAQSTDRAKAAYMGAKPINIHKAKSQNQRVTVMSAFVPSSSLSRWRLEELESWVCLLRRAVLQTNDCLYPINGETLSQLLHHLPTTITSLTHIRRPPCNFPV